mmetsp:Transcript_140355/g.448588  ORF Transcript_140355/g.448588 Transcript_140355/m.448588 type:complete len:200 (+) Transcript_140355:147-746(+)
MSSATFSFPPASETVCTADASLRNCRCSLLTSATDKSLKALPHKKLCFATAARTCSSAGMSPALLRMLTPTADEARTCARSAGATAARRECTSARTSSSDLAGKDGHPPSAAAPGGLASRISFFWTSLERHPRPAGEATATLAASASRTGSMSSKASCLSWITITAPRIVIKAGFAGISCCTGVGRGWSRAGCNRCGIR